MRISVNGSSGLRYDFTISMLGSLPQSEAGVYMLLREVQPNQIEVLYVGETEDFSDRLFYRIQQHDAYQRAVFWGVSHYGVMPLADRRSRLSVETDLRHGLAPRGNHQSVPVKQSSLADVIAGLGAPTPSQSASRMRLAEALLGRPVEQPTKDVPRGLGLLGALLR